MRGDALDEPLDHGEGALAIDLGRQRRQRLGGGQLAQHREQARQQRQVVADGVGERALLQLALLHGALEQRGGAVDDLVERVVGDGLVLAARAAQHDATGLARLVEDRLGERALADARLARDERHVAGAGLRERSSSSTSTPLHHARFTPIHIATHQLTDPPVYHQLHRQEPCFSSTINPILINFIP